MKRLLAMQKQLLPDLLDVMKKRYDLLRHIQLLQPIGRRSLAVSVNMTERVLRGEVDFLKRQGLVVTQSVGMSLTEEGRQLVDEMELLMKELFGLGELEQELAVKFGLSEVVIVPGNADQSLAAKKALGRAGANVLLNKARPGDVIAVNGGTTVAAVAEMLTDSPVLKETIFVPSRGGLGEAVELQANYLASLMAKKTGASYRLMHVPDQMSEAVYRSLMNEPNILDVLKVIRRARIVLHGIGDALAMATRRNAPASLIAKLRERKAVGEAFGYYFNRRGEIVHRMQTVGLRLEDVHQAEIVIAVAGGASKGEAIASVCRGGSRDILVTDEAAAQSMIHLLAKKTEEDVYRGYENRD